MIAFGKEAASAAKVFRIAPTDTNYFAVLFDPEKDGIKNVFVVEIFTPGGATPPNTHNHADEFFYVLSGEGIARCGTAETPLKTGDALLLRPGHEHIVHNTGTAKLYCLTVMTPNEGFAELIRSGHPMELDAEDLKVLGG
ncbi:cupin domain-containing protein [Acidisoma cladoniae]|jgi:mannose-6-phosphate isomerase-like protein (cupin superfamily)|uniref:cupin domain-containing protein n=1 Tax=Acidisoma cladoniae TaxID=3040935 RepID=UPI00254F54C3|nr:cupin domain-containing protein [Acidisoma sp. PAMC 29798]